MNKQWLKLIIAAILEVFWVIGLAHAFDFWTWAATVILIIVSNYLMITVAQVLPAGTVYAVFVGLGAGGTVIAEILFFGEPLQWEKIFLIAVLLAGVIGLKSVTENKNDKVEKGVRS
jgi:paired small multidrug resistance pump